MTNEEPCKHRISIVQSALIEGDNVTACTKCGKEIPFTYNGNGWVSVSAYSQSEVKCTIEYDYSPSTIVPSGIYASSRPRFKVYEEPST